MRSVYGRIGGLSIGLKTDGRPRTEDGSGLATDARTLEQAYSCDVIQPPEQEPPMNLPSVWRLALARRAAVPYIENLKVAAFIVGGSVSRGHADRFSDLEMGGFWHEPPTDEERTAAAQAAVEAVGGEVAHVYPYDPAEEVWEEDLF